jgi:hypothetical protein
MLCIYVDLFRIEKLINVQNKQTWKVVRDGKLKRNLAHVYY